MQRLFKIIIITVCLFAMTAPGYAWDSFRKALGIDGSISFSLVPATDDTYHLGSSTYQWDDLYIDGLAYIDGFGESSATSIALTTAIDGLSFITTNTITSGESNAIMGRGRSVAVGASTAEVRGVYARGTVNDNLYGGTVTALQTETIAKTGSTVVNLRGAFIAVDSEGTPAAITNMYGGYIRVKTTVAPVTDFYALVLENELFGGGVVADAAMLVKGTGHFLYGIDLNSALVDTADIRLINGETISNTTNGVIALGGIIANTPGTQTVTTEADMADPLTSSIMLITGDDDTDNDIIQLQDGTKAGQILHIVAVALVDADDTITVDTTTDSTCTNCSAIVFNKIGENATLLWTGTTWVLTSIIDSL